MAVNQFNTNNPRLKDITGQRYSRLTVISRAGNTKAGLAQWNCVCDCGNKTISTGGNLRSGISNSCGCYQKQRCKDGGIKRRKHFDGKKHFMLTVIRRDELQPSKLLCLCECGNEKLIEISDFNKGNYKSCGCSKREFISQSLTKPKEHHAKTRAAKYQRFKQIPVKALEIRVRSCIASAFRYEGLKKNSKSSAILGCTYQELKLHIEKQFTDGMSWDRFSEIQIDHIVPMATAKTEDDVIKLNHHTNLRPMWAKDNMLKSDSIEFLI